MTNLERNMRIYEKKLPGESRTKWLNRVYAMRVYVLLSKSEVLKGRSD